MSETSLRPSTSVTGQVAYRVPRAPTPVDLYLDGNEGAWPPEALLDVVREAGVGVVRSYPKAAELEALLAGRVGVEPERMLVTAGADDALYRLCLAMLEPGRSMILPEPSFEMLGRYARLAGGDVVSVEWSGGAFPTDAVLAQADASTAIVMVVTPNNPTGAVATLADVERLARALPQALVVVDHAYAEFADEDLSALASEHANVVVTRTLSKAWGMAGLRVGYVYGAREVIDWLRVAGNPYAVAGPSLTIAKARLAGGEGDMAAFVARVRQERVELSKLLEELGARTEPSQANFVFARFATPARALWVRDALAGLGIAVRAFPGRAGLEDAVRVTCPGDAESFARLCHALRAALSPDALLFDLDGVIADVSRSYRQAIIETARSFGVEVTGEDIAAAKARGNANNDWDVTHRLLSARGVDAPFAEVRRRFEDLYQGTPDRPGLCTTETMLCDPALLDSLGRRLPLAVVTGRPRSDARTFFTQFDLAPHFETVVCMEDAPLKPDPAPVRLALERLGAHHAWMIGDTPDDMRAARAAGVVPIGIVAPGEHHATSERVLYEAGAARVVDRLDELEALLP